MFCKTRKGKMRNAYKVSTGKSEVISWEDNIKVYFREIRWEDVDWVI